MLNLAKRFFALSSAVILLFGCAQPPAPQVEGGGAPNAPATAEGKELTVGIVFDSGGRGDKSFNDSAWAGIERAIQEFRVKEINLSSPTAAAYETNLRQLAAEEVDLVIAVGLGMENALARVAPAFPDVKFAIVDGSVNAPNVRALKFREEQGSFLAGYLAGLMSKSQKIGFVGGMEIDLIKKFEFGYAAGARMANPGITVLPSKFTGDWNNADKGKQAAAALYGGGADIVYHAAGRAGLGVFAAAKDARKFAIGVDSNQDSLQPGLILTSMIKRVDNAVFATIEDVKNGAFTAGEKVYDVASGGVGLTEFEFTRDKIGEANLAKLKDIRERLAAGEIRAPATKAEFDAFVAALPSR